jgi:hypothetical protein
MAAKRQKKTAGGRAKGQRKAGRTKAGGISGSTIVLTTLSLGALGVLGYLGWQYMKSRKAKRAGNLDEALIKSGASGGSSFPSGISLEPLSPVPGNSIPDSISNPIPISPGGGRKTTGSSSGDDFPLRKGSKGENVRLLQEALIRKYGSKTLPKHGADGDFGTETANALKKLKMPATISETFFNVLTQGSDSTAGGGSDLSSLAVKIYNATMKRDFNTVLSLLKNIKSSSDYSTVSEAFKQYRLSTGVRKTLVTGLLDTFNTASQKQQLRLAFAAMGLTYDGNKWSLSGIDGIPIVTVIPAKVWINANTAVTVPARMVLGNEVARRLQYVMFNNNGRYFLVHSNCIKHL